MSLPTLFKLTSTGKIQMWKIEANPDGYLDASIVTTYGLLTGKQQEAVEYISEGKNLGKANATTPEEQAVAEAQSQWEKKKKKGYVENLADAEQGKIDTNSITGGIEPMLAHRYDEQGHKIVYPAYVQPKLDGHRCIAIIQNKKCTLWSRTRKPITGVPHIIHQIEDLFRNINDGHETLILDGELYNHDYRDKFEELTSFIRQETPKPGHEVVEYWIYDIPQLGSFQGRDFSRRASMLKQFDALLKNFSKDVSSLKVLETSDVTDEEEMISIFGVYIDHGFEGLMVRNAAGVYKNKRSYDLQKVKVFQDAEFKIVDITEGKGKMAGKAMFHVVTDDGKEFRVKMVGELDSLKHYYENKDQYIGQLLTVKLQKLSADGVPIFPIGLRVREDI